MVAESRKAIELKGQIVQNVLQKFHILSGPPCKNF